MIQPSVPFQPTRRAFLGAGLCFGALGFAGQAMAATNAQRLVAAARRQIGVTLRYDPAYTVLPFPNGDVDRESFLVEVTDGKPVVKATLPMINP